jgi:hypothetical protein
VIWDLLWGDGLLGSARGQACATYAPLREDDRPVMRAFFGASVGSYVGGGLLLWLPEHVWLACDHPPQRLQLHALFHLTSAVGSYAWLRMMMHHRDRPPRTVAPTSAIA